MRVIGCLLGIHRKKWVGVFDYVIPPQDQKCPHGHWAPKIYCETCRGTVQVARWACEVCIKMGERSIMKGNGLYKIEYGFLVPDEKRWGDPTDPKAGAG